MKSQVPLSPAPLTLSPDAAALKPKAPLPVGQLATVTQPVAETGGPKGAEPTRFGDWERKGRCSDF
jgi:hypothetical protein